MDERNLFIKFSDVGKCLVDFISSEDYNKITDSIRCDNKSALMSMVGILGCWIYSHCDTYHIKVVQKGEWTFDPLAGDWICSECDLHSMEHGKYCPNCGANMER